MAAFLGEAVAKLILDASGFNQELARSAGNLDKFRGRADAISDGLRVIGTGFVSAGVGIAAGLGAAIKQAADFQTIMQNVASISPEVAADMDNMAEGVLRIATETARMPTDLASGLYEVVSAAIPASQALDVLESAARSANAGLTSTATAVKVTVGLLNSGIKDMEGNFLTLEKAQDISFQAVNRGLFTYEELASQIGDVLPLAASLGVTYEEVAAFLATATQNTNSLSESTTQLNAVMSAFLKPTEDVTKMFNEMGYESGQALLTQEGLTKALDLVNKHLEATGDNTSDFSKNIRAIRGILAVTNDEMVSYNENLEFMEHATGATDRALAQQSKTLSFALKELKANLSVLAIGVGTAFLPVITGLTKAITELVQLINKIPGPIKTVLAVFAAIASAGLIMAGGLALAGAAIFRIGLAMEYLKSASLGITGPLQALIFPLTFLRYLFVTVATGAISLFNPLRLIGSVVAAIVAPFRAFGIALRFLASVFSPILVVMRSLGLGLTALRIALGGAIPLILRFRIAFFGLRVIMTTILSPISQVIGLIGVLVGTFLGAIGAILAFTAIILGVVTAFATWSAIRDDIRNVADEIRGLLKLADPLRDFFDFSKDTEQVDKNSKAIRENTKSLRDRIAEALGVQTKKDPSMHLGIGGIPVFEEGKAAKNVGFLKRLDRALKVSGKEIRAWSNKAEIGKRAIGDFFDIVGGKGGKDELKTFRARLNDVFGPEAGGKIYSATQKMRTGIADLNRELSKRLGVDNLLSLEGATLFALEGFNRLSQFVRESVVPAFGEFLATVIDLGGGFVNLAADIVSGDFGAVVDDLISITTTFLSGIVVPVTEVTIKILGWVWEGIETAYDELKKAIFAAVGGTGNGGERSVDAADFGKESPTTSVSIGTVGVAIAGWLIKGGENLFGLLRSKVIELAFGSSSSIGGGNGASGSPLVGGGDAVGHDLGDALGVITVRVGGWLVEQGEVLAEAVGEKIKEWWDQAKGAGTDVFGWTVKAGGWLIEEGDSIQTALQRYLDKLTGTNGTVKRWILYLNDPSNVSLKGDVNAAVTEEANKKSTTAILAKWYLIATGKPVTTVNQSEVEKSIQDNLRNVVVGTGEGLSWTAIMSSNPIFRGIVGFPKALNDALNLADRPVSALIKFWNVELGAPKSVNANIFSLGQFIGAEVTEKLGAIHVPRWHLDLGTPSFGGIGGLFGLDNLGIKIGIAKIIGILKVPIDWIADLQIPEINVPDIDWSGPFATIRDGFMAALPGLFGGGGDGGTKQIIPLDINPFGDGSDIDLKIGHEDAFPGLVDSVVGTIESMLDLMEISEEALAPIAQFDWAGKLKGVGTKLWDGFRAALPGIFEDDGGGTKQLIPLDINPFGDGTDMTLAVGHEDGPFSAAVGDIVTGIVDAVKGIPDKVAQAVGVPDFSLIKDGLKTALDQMKPDMPDWIDTFISELGKKINSIKTKLGELIGLRNEENAKNAPQPRFPSQPNARGEGQNNASEFDPFTGQDLPVADPDPIEVTQDVNVALKFSLNGADSGSVGDNFSDALDKFLSIDGKQEPAPVDVPIDPKFTMKEGTTPDLSSLFTTFKPTGDGTEESGGGIPVTITIDPTFALSKGTDVGALITGMLGSVESVSESAAMLTASIFSGLQSFLPTATALGLETGDNYAAGVTSQAEAVSASATALTQAIFDIIQGFLGTATDIGTETGGNYADGVGSQSGAAGDAGGSLVDSAVAAMSGGYGAAYSAGQNVGAGLAAGIASMVGAVAAAAAALANASIVSTSTAYALHSPSKVFHKIGLMVGQGLANGIESTTRMVEKASESMVSTPTPNVPGSRRVVLNDGRARKLKDLRPHVDFHGATFVVPNLDTAAQIEAYFLNLSR
jgi:TP901 family phage tail tape measure protein